jgi:hypothetical protein
VARRPGPAWLYYLGAAVFFFVLYVLVKWWEGAIPRGIVSQWALLVIVIGFYYLAAIHYLDGIARDAMERFRPAIAAPKQRVAELEYRLTTMPAKMVWLMTLLGTLEGILTLVGIALGMLSYPGLIAFASLPAMLLEATIVIFGGICFVVAVYHTVHQLRTVSIIYTELTKIDLFQQGPLHAFARLTVYTAASWIIPQYFWLTSGFQEGAFGVSLGFFSVVLILGAITLTWPLLGIHKLLAAEKEKLQGAVTKRLQTCLLMVEQALEKDDLAQMGALNSALDNVERERRIVDAIPTWPWQPGLLRGAVTAVLLPLFLWIVTRVLESFFAP